MVVCELLPRRELRLRLSAPTLPPRAVELVLARREGHLFSALFVRNEERSLCDASASPLIAPRKLPRRAASSSAAWAAGTLPSGGSFFDGTVELHRIRERCERTSWCEVPGSALTSVNKKAAAAAKELYCPAADCCTERYISERDPVTELRLDATTDGRRVCSPGRGVGREVRRARARRSSVTDARREGE